MEDKDSTEEEFPGEFSTTVLNSVPDAVCLINVHDFRIVGVNKAFLKQLDLTEKQAIGRTCYEITHGRTEPCRPPDHICPLMDVVAGAKHSVVEHVHLTAHGEKVYVEVSATPVFGRNGEVTQVVHVATDITERKRAEEALRASEARYRNTLDNMLEGCQVIGYDWRYLYVNDAVARQGRRTKEELLGHTMMEVYPGIENTEMFTALRRCMEQRTPQRMENEFAFPDGTKGWFELSIEPVPDGVLIFSLDITERKRAEESLLRKNRHLSTIYKIDQVTAHSLDLEKVFKEALDAILDALGIEAGGILLLERDGETMTLRAHRGLSNEFVKNVQRIKSGEGISGRAAAERRPVVLDVSGYPTERLAAYIVGEGFQTLASTPLLSAGELIGALALGTRQPRLFPPEEHELLTSIGYQVGNAVRRAQLHEKVQQEVAERRQAQEALRKTSRALRTLSLCNQVLIRATDESDLLQRICQTISEVGGYRLVWIGFAERDAEKTVRPVAWAGYENGYLSTVKVTWADTELGWGPSGKAIRTGETIVVRDILTDPDYAPWRAEAIQRGYASRAALPLIAETQTFGVLNIYSSEPDAFDAEEVKLLAELANDLTYGIMALRMTTERKQAEKALIESEERYRALFENARDGIVLYDAESGAVVDCNPEFERETGRQLAQLSNLTMWQLRPPKLVELTRQLFNEIKQHGQVGPIESAYELPNGELVPVEYSSKLITVHGKQYLQSMARDITERKRTEEIRRKGLEYEELNKLKSNLLSTVSHELRTPLAIIKGYATMLLDYERRLRRDEKREYLEAIDKATDRLAELVDHLLDMSRLEVGLLKLDKRPTDMSHLTQEAIAEARIRTLTHEIALRLPKRLPKVNGDARRIRQVLDNLLDNAAKYSRPGTEIVVQAKRVGTEVQVSVADQGIGIPAEELTRVFDRMYRLEQRLSQDPGGDGARLGPV